MKVYELLPDSNNYEVLTYANPEDSKNVIGLFCGEPIGALWKPVKVIILRDDNHQDRPPSDFPSWGGVRPVFSRRAVSALGELLTANGELLPLECESGDYMAYNVTCVRNALDESLSELKRFSRLLIFSALEAAKIRWMERIK